MNTHRKSAHNKLMMEVREKQAAQQPVGTAEENSPKMVLKDYLKLPQEEHHMLRFELY